MNLVALVTMILLAREVYAAIPLGIPLTGKQLNQIEMNIALIQIIKQNYFKDRKFYSSLPPIVQLNKNQEEQILAQYGHLFSETKPDILSSYVFNGTEYTENTADIASTGMAVCPSSIGYSDITFTVNAENEVLQMVQVREKKRFFPKSSTHTKKRILMELLNFHFLNCW